MEPAITADVLIQAGHEGRTTGRLGAVGPLGKEIEWTPIVADAATEKLRAHGVNVLRVNADEIRDRYYKVVAAVYIHFDGNDEVCVTGASIGYPGEHSEFHNNCASSAEAADAWRAMYSQHIPYRFMPDNFTKNLLDYYGFGPVEVTDCKLVLEMGEIDCPEQATWMQPRLQWMGHMVAHFLSQRIQKGNVPHPGPPNA